MHMVELEPAGPGRVPQSCALTRRKQAPPDVCRQHIVGAGLLVQGVAQTVLPHAKAVPGGRIVAAETGLPGGGKGLLRDVFLDLLELLSAA